MFDLVKGALSTVVGAATKHPVLAGLGLAGLILPKLMGGGASPQAMMGMQSAIGGQIPQGGVPPAGGVAPPPGASF